MPEPLKHSYNEAYIERLSKALKKHHKRFKPVAFQQSIFDDSWEQRELKERMSHIRHCLHEHLNLPYREALAVLLPAAKDFGSYEGMFFPEYVEVYGLDSWKPSMKALEILTQYSSSEFAVRPFIEKDEERMMAQMQSWAQHKNHHVRRLSSEGCRPRLPWARALPVFKKDPRPIEPILNALRRDDSEYVRRSVANNLNDIAKDNPDRVLNWCEKYHQQNPLTDWIIKHGCRTLLKQAHPEALALFGYSPIKGLSVTNFNLNPHCVAIGDHLGFSFSLKKRSGNLGRLRIEYGIDYRKANGNLSRKIFKITEGQYSDNSLHFERRQSFLPMSTRRHYPGEHRLAVIVNGRELAVEEFEVIK